MIDKLNIFKQFQYIILISILSGCGPKDIGYETSQYTYPEEPPTAAEIMRYPMLGVNNIQKKLYYDNKPDVIQKVQQWQLQQFNNQFNSYHYSAKKIISPESPEYRSTPKQKSPFRQ